MRFEFPPAIRIATSLLTLSLALAASPSRATTIVRHTVEEMTHIADEVVLGTVASTESHWTDDRQQILTYVTVTATERLKGPDTGDVTFVQLGGTVGTDFMVALGTPAFATGERVVVFLGRMNSDKRLAVPADRWLLGLGQGKWGVTTNAATGRSSAHVGLEGAHVIERPGLPIETDLDLTQLRARVIAAATLR
jgi:hypothetical protein